MAFSDRVVMVLDLGTSGCKGAVYSAAGERGPVASAEYPLERPAPGHVEQNPRDYLEAAQSISRELARAAGRIAAIGFSTQTPTLVFCDEAGEAVAPAIIWQDSRAGEEAAALASTSTEEQRREWFGLDLPAAAAATPPKMLWMARRRTEAWQRTRWVAQPKDYAAFHLTGAWATDRWCAKGILHLTTGAMHRDYLARLGKACSVSPPALAPEHVAGRVTELAARAWGLEPGAPVITGWSDAMAGILATGALHTDLRGFVLSGTSEIVGMSRPECEKAGGLFRVPGDLLNLRGLELHYGPTQAGGACLEWAANLFGRTPLEILATLEGRALTEIVFRPYLFGERAPYWDHTLTATFDGLRAGDGMPEMAHAILQGVALQERLVLERAERGTSVRDVVLAGGAARDRGWNQLRANVLQRPCVVMDDVEASLRGVALLAWAAIDPAMLREPPPSWFAGEEVLPDPSCAALAERLIERFRI